MYLFPVCIYFTIFGCEKIKNSAKRSSSSFLKNEIISPCNLFDPMTRAKDNYILPFTTFTAVLLQNIFV